MHVMTHEKEEKIKTQIEHKWDIFANWYLILVWSPIGDQSMSPIANIEITIKIPIFTKNCDPDPDRHLKNDRRSRS